MTFKEAVKFLLAQNACLQDECKDCPFRPHKEEDLCHYRGDITTDKFKQNCEEAKRIVSLYIADISAETDKWL